MDDVQPDDQAPSASVDERRGPVDVDFDHASGYVNENQTYPQPDIYNQFLGILETYQWDRMSPWNVYEQMRRLFHSAPDLLEDFKRFLPESAAHRVMRMRSWQTNGDTKRLLESGKGVLKDYYTRDQYVQRRGGFLANNFEVQLCFRAMRKAEMTYPIRSFPQDPEERKNTFASKDQYFLAVLLDLKRRAPDWNSVARNDAEVVFRDTEGPLSVQEICRRELQDKEDDGKIETLTPLPTVANTQMLLDVSFYPSTEWTPNNQSSHPDLNSDLAGSLASFTSQSGLLPIVYGNGGIAPSFSQTTADLQTPLPPVSAPPPPPVPRAKSRLPPAPVVGLPSTQAVLANLNSYNLRKQAMTNQAQQSNANVNGQAPSDADSMYHQRPSLFGGTPSPPRYTGPQQQVPDLLLGMGSAVGTMTPNQTAADEFSEFIEYSPHSSPAYNNNIQAVDNLANIRTYDRELNADGIFDNGTAAHNISSPTTITNPVTAPTSNPFPAPVSAPVPAPGQSILGAIANGIVRPNNNAEARAAADERLLRLMRTNPAGRTVQLGLEFPPLPEYWPDPESSVYCVCGLPGDDLEMIQCDGCHCWNHVPCIQGSFAPGTDYADEFFSYSCPECAPDEHVELLMEVRKKFPV